MPVATILLARHGESDWNEARRFQGHADRPLTRRGREQALLLAAELADVPLAAVYSSDLHRARATAEIVAAARGLSVATDRDLREIDVGALTGLTYDEACAVRAEARADIDALDYQAYQGESFAELQVRALAAIRRIGAAHPEATTLVVGHGAMIRAVLAAHAGVDLVTHRTQTAPADNGTVTRLEVRLPDNGGRVPEEPII